MLILQIAAGIVLGFFALAILDAFFRGQGY